MAVLIALISFDFFDVMVNLMADHDLGVRTVSTKQLESKWLWVNINQRIMGIMTNHGYRVN